MSAPDALIEHWDGFPPVREQYFASRAALRARVEDSLRDWPARQRAKRGSRL